MTFSCKIWRVTFSCKRTFSCKSRDLHENGLLHENVIFQFLHENVLLHENVINPKILAQTVKNIKFCIMFLEHIVVKGMTESFRILLISSKSAFISSFEKWLERQTRQPTAPLIIKRRAAARSSRDLRFLKVCLSLTNRNGWFRWFSLKQFDSFFRCSTSREEDFPDSGYLDWFRKRSNCQQEREACASWRVASRWAFFQGRSKVAYSLVINFVFRHFQRIRLMNTCTRFLKSAGGSSPASLIKEMIWTRSKKWSKNRNQSKPKPLSKFSQFLIKTMSLAGRRARSANPLKNTRWQYSGRTTQDRVHSWRGIS